MDVCDTPRRPLVLAERISNAAAMNSRRSQTREVSSRYKSPSPSTPSVSRRCPSPTLSRTLSANSQVGPKRAQSAERRRPLTPSSPSSLSTPIQDTSADIQLSTRRLSTGGRLPESLWPSTMRSLSVSFQSDSILVPVGKKIKPVSNASSDRTLRPSLNVAHKQAETLVGSQKSTAERKRSPLKGKNSQDQSENAKPVDASHSRLVDQHRWPSRIGGKLSSSSLNKGMDLVEKTARALSRPITVGLSSLRKKPSPDGLMKPLEKAASDVSRLSSQAVLNSFDKSLLHLPLSPRVVSTSLDHLSLSVSTAKTQPLPAAPDSRPDSPSRNSVSRGISPVRTGPSTPRSRGVSPSRIRPSSVNTQPNKSTSVLSFIADFSKVKKGASYIDDAHHLRLVYNRYLQWRFTNARAESVLYVQKVSAEKTLFSVWDATVALWDSVIRKRINLQQLKLELKLDEILIDQIAYLDNWDLLEKDHVSSLSGAVEDLKASTLRLPVTGGAKADIESLKLAICSAVDVMRAMGSSMCSLLSRMEKMNALVSDLSMVAAQEKGMLNQCESVLASTAAKQVEDCSVCTHLIQIKHDDFLPCVL